MVNIEERLTKELDITLKQVQNVIKLLDEGNTVPFISRYRKEQTGGLSDDVLRKFFERLTYLRNLKDRKEDVLRLIDEQGKLNDDIVKALEKADTLTEVDDIYRPYKQKKRTRATIALEKGLKSFFCTKSNRQHAYKANHTDNYCSNGPPKVYAVASI